MMISLSWLMKLQMYDDFIIMAYEVTNYDNFIIMAYEVTNV